MLAKNILPGKSSPRVSGRLERNSIPNKDLLIVGVGSGVLMALLLFVKGASILTRLEPIVPDQANKEPSTIDPSSFVATPGSAGVLACHALTKGRLSEVNRRERPRSRAAAIKFKQPSCSGGQQP
jgi:hypothetical protein